MGLIIKETQEYTEKRKEELSNILSEISQELDKAEKTGDKQEIEIWEKRLMACVGQLNALSYTGEFEIKD